jgi:HEAT repeat protein
MAAPADEEQDLIATLQSGAGATQKCAACQRLRVVGTPRAVAALAALLGEERISHAARYALEGMPFAEAGAALRRALGQTSGLTQAGLVDSIGWRRDLEAVPLLTPLLAGGDVVLASAAAAALGKIGGEDAVAALLAVRDVAKPSLGPVVWDSLLGCAEKLLADGDARGAAAVYRSLLDRPYSAPIRAAAWRGVVVADAEARAGLVAEALSTEDPVLHPVALRVIRELGDAQVVKACLDRWASLAEDGQLAVLDAWIKLGREVLAVVEVAAKSPHHNVRIVAWQALGDWGDGSSITALAQAAASGEGPERAAAREALSRVRGTGVREAWLKRLEDAPAAEKAELLRALGQRGDAEAAAVLVRYAAAGLEPMRLAALESLRILAVPGTLSPLMDVAVRSRSDQERDPVLWTLHAICQASRDPDQTTKRFMDAWNRFTASERIQVASLLSELATPAALEAALAATRDADLGLVKEAVRVLSRWPSAAPATRLLELARASNDPALQTLALRGCIEVSGHEPDPAQRLALLQRAMGTAGRADEKRQVLGQIGLVPTPEALEFVVPFLSEAALVQEAELAAVNIGERIAATHPKLAAAVAGKVLVQCRTAEVIKRAWALRGKPKTAGPFILAWLVSGPYSQAGANDATAVFNVVFTPEKPDETVAWKPVPRADMVDLLGLFPNQVNCVAYLKTTLIAPEEGSAALLLGSDDGIKAWLNGVVVHANNVDRGAGVDQDLAPVKLKKGPNELMLKITQGGGGWAACARIVGPDGLPIAGLQTQLNP